eukprot:Tamp_34205.p1 GENE.Tamp_34205~~Tamp_34205.p1  ORF type:complete len:104 (+),score=7.56 Tamp_34205:166-477(+)
MKMHTHTHAHTHTHTCIFNMKMHICIYFYEKIPLRGLPQTLPESSAVWHDHFFFFLKYQYEAPPKHCQKAVLCGEKTAEAEASLSGLLLFLFYFISCKALYAL